MFADLGEETEAFFASGDLGLALIRPARMDQKQPRPFPHWRGSGSRRSSGR